EFKSVAVADVNGDGKPDVVVGNCGDSTVGVLLGNGDGTFQPAVTYFTYFSGCWNPTAVAVADLNGDGKPDLVMGCGSIAAVGVMLGNGDGTFQPAVTYDSGPGYAVNYVAVADVNRDGKLDLVVTNCGADGCASGGPLAVLLGNGDGTFQPAVTYDSGGRDPWSVAVADVNGDGNPDLLVANYASGTVGVLLGNGDGTFKAAVTYASGAAYPVSIAITDVNGDGRPDLLVANQTAGEGRVGVLLGNGDGTFQPVATDDSGGARADEVAVADVNGDGKPDLLTANEDSDTVGVLLGNGDGTFQPALTFGAGGYYPDSIIVADVNGDGRPDLVVGGGYWYEYTHDKVGVLLNNTGPHAPTTTTLVPSLNPAPVGQSINYTAAVTSQEGGAVTGSVTFQDRGSSIATVPLANNQAAYSTKYKTGGSHAITAAYSGDLHNLGSTSATLMEYITVATKTVVTTSGSPSFVGQPVTFTATVTSKYGTIPDGELVTFYDGTTTLGSVALAGGTAAHTTSSLSAKWHYIKAQYAGDTAFTASIGSVQQVVVKYPTTTTLTSGLNPSNYGQAVTLTAKVTSAGPAPTGTVTFRNGSVIPGSKTLNASGVAILTTTKIPVGTDALTDTYNGDAFNAKSVSAAITQTVSQASVSMVLTSYPNPSSFGASVKFTAKLTSNGGLPSGQPVTFSYNGATLGTANVNTGVATLSTITLPRGSDAVTAAYAGTVDYSSASATVTQVVN